MYTQFSIATLPLLAILIYQAVSASDLAKRVDTAMAVYDSALQASRHYQEFLNAVIDAVDIGELSSNGMGSLEQSRSIITGLSGRSDSSNVGKAGQLLDGMYESISNDNSIMTLMPLRQDINLAEEALDALIVDIKTQLSEMVAADEAKNQKNRTITTVIGAATLVLLAFMIYRMVNGVTVPIKAALVTAQRVAEGDLTSTIEVTRTDEIGDLQQALVAMNKNLVSIVTEVRLAMDLVANSTDTIAYGNLDLSDRTERQASSLEETAASMSELTEVVNQNAENAGKASKLARASRDVATRGGRAVGDVVSTMNEINNSSGQIASIISIIDEIAFQTKILALNAAVEAARAGDQGRGFAVVATEVRNLAERSLEAAKEIKDLIEDSLGKVKSGSEQVNNAGQTMKEIVDSVNQVSSINDEITVASDEQSAGITQVNQAISHMDQLTQQNAALVEEAAAAAASLKEQSEGLVVAVKAFKLPEGELTSKATRIDRIQIQDQRHVEGEIV
jgi:methyl-accepting chemotaxis protein